MPYRVRVDWAPAHELVMSLDAYAAVSSHRSLDLGDAWVAQTREKLPAALAACTEAPPLAMLTPLLHQCPGPRTPAGFFRWLAGLTPGEMYERLVAETALPADLEALRDKAVDLLTRWDEAYFRQVDPGLLERLAGAASALGEQACSQADPVALVEEATRGIYVAPDAAIDEIRLVPQFHKRPITLTVAGRRSLTFYVPAPDSAGAPGEPGGDLLRQVRALADESRLRLLHDLAGGPRTFMELVAASGLTKGTVHRHVWTLRFAGLVRANYADGRLALRPGAFERVAAHLQGFVTQR
ncbi:MAG TPA: winged helix-turn-helix domain-containing protein [Symbiobacteriaceae bacterium]|nr:winged helix-turn-helix domain-containing protein [Symbiobacteriaceae bacterium]